MPAAWFCKCIQKAFDSPNKKTCIFLKHEKFTQKCQISSHTFSIMPCTHCWFYKIPLITIRTPTACCAMLCVATNQAWEEFVTLFLRFSNLFLVHLQHFLYLWGKIAQSSAKNTLTNMFICRHALQYLSSHNNNVSHNPKRITFWKNLSRRSRFYW